MRTEALAGSNFDVGGSCGGISGCPKERSAATLAAAAALAHRDARGRHLAERNDLTAGAFWQGVAGAAEACMSPSTT